MPSKINDGWHTFLGVRVWVEKNRVKYADLLEHGRGYLYRRAGGKWLEIDSASASSFYLGMKAGYITLMPEGGSAEKKYQLVDGEGNVIWVGCRCPMLWRVTCYGNGDDMTSTCYSTRKEALSAVADAVEKNTCVTIEEVWGA